MSNSRSNTAVPGAAGGGGGKKTPAPSTSRRGSSTGTPNKANPANSSGAGAAGGAGAGSSSSNASSRPQSPVVTTSGSQNTTPDLSALLNCRLRLTVVATGDLPQRELEGTLWTYDPATSFVVITTPSASANPSVAASAAKRNYHLLRTSQIKNVTVLSHADPNSSATTEPLRSIDFADVQSRVEKAVQEDKKMRARVGQGVSEEAQALFDALAKTLPVRWHEKSIVVLDEVIIGPPYTVEQVKGGKGATQYVERVKKVLEGERQRRAARAVGFP